MNIHQWVRDFLPPIWPLDAENVIWAWRELGWILGLVILWIFLSDLPRDFRTLREGQRAIGLGYLSMTAAAVAIFIGMAGIDAGWLAIGFVAMGALGSLVQWLEKRSSR